MKRADHLTALPGASTEAASVSLGEYLSYPGYMYRDNWLPDGRHIPCNRSGIRFPAGMSELSELHVSRRLAAWRHGPPLQRKRHPLPSANTWAIRSTCIETTGCPAARLGAATEAASASPQGCLSYPNYPLLSKDICAIRATFIETAGCLTAGPGAAMKAPRAIGWLMVRRAEARNPW